MDTPSFVQVAPDSTGAKVHTLDVVAYINDVPVTLKMTGVRVVDGEGRPIDLDQSANTQLLSELKAIRALLQHAIGIELP
jgi:hypothetical protein